MFSSLAPQTCNYTDDGIVFHSLFLHHHPKTDNRLVVPHKVFDDAQDIFPNL